MLTSIVGVVVLLGGLVFFHEFGHYIIAKLFGVKVEVFSLGFGRKIFKKQIGETEYCLSLFPLGGYVKLMGDDPYKGVPAGDAERAFSTQKLYKRFLIVAAGPIFNLILAYALFMLVFWIGQPMDGTRLGTVLVSSPAWDAGLRPLDKVLEIDGVPVHTWTEMKDKLRNRVGEKIELKVDRASAELRIPFTVGKVRQKNPYGEEEEVGGIKGISPNPLQSRIGVSDPNSIAGKAGLSTGDVVTRVDTRGIETYEELRDALQSEWKEGKPLTITVHHEGEKPSERGPDRSVTFAFPKLPADSTPLSPLDALGIYPSELFVVATTSGSPAERGGLLAGDRLIKVAENFVYNFDGIVDTVQSVGTKNGTVALSLERAGQKMLLNIKPVETSFTDPLTQETSRRYMLGFKPNLALSEGELYTFKVREPVALVQRAFHETNMLAKQMVVSLWKLVTGSISVKNLGGPVLIASVAGRSLDAGLVPFLHVMALISINLFLLNLFPIPVLDGGHLLFFTIEAIKGKPVSIRTMEIASQVGTVLILMLVALTLFNDITRIIFH